MKWVLILYLYLAGDRGGVGVTSVEFDTQATCEAAGAAMLAWLSGSAPADKIRVQAAVFTARGTTGPAPKAR